MKKYNFNPIFGQNMKGGCKLQEVYVVPEQNKLMLEADETSFEIDVTPSEFTRSEAPGWGVRMGPDSEAKTHAKIMRYWLSDGHTSMSTKYRESVFYWNLYILIP